MSQIADMLCLDHFVLVIGKLSLSFIPSCRADNLDHFVW